MNGGIWPGYAWWEWWTIMRALFFVYNFISWVRLPFPLNFLREQMTGWNSEQDSSVCQLDSTVFAAVGSPPPGGDQLVRRSQGSQGTMRSAIGGDSVMLPRLQYLVNLESCPSIKWPPDLWVWRVSLYSGYLQGASSALRETQCPQSNELSPASWSPFFFFSFVFRILKPRSVGWDSGVISPAAPSSVRTPTPVSLSPKLPLTLPSHCPLIL